jgi:hypothetical protein
VILGIPVIGMSLLFLLDNLDGFDFHRAIPFWPVAFIAAGIVKVWDSRCGTLLGAIWVVLVLILNGPGLVRFSWEALWPLLLIVRGLAAVRGHDRPPTTGGGRRGRRDQR